MAVQVNTCQTCGKEWTRESRKGRRPLFCPACKEEKQASKPPPTEEEKREAAARRRAAANEQIDNLEMALKSRGNHLSQQRERRTYYISDLEQRIHELEEWKRDLEEQVGIVRLIKEWKEASEQVVQPEESPEVGERRQATEISSTVHSSTEESNQKPKRTRRKAKV